MRTPRQTTEKGNQTEPKQATSKRQKQHKRTLLSNGSPVKHSSQNVPRRQSDRNKPPTQERRPTKSLAPTPTFKRTPHNEPSAIQTDTHMAVSHSSKNASGEG